ncbi:CLUMA_CG013594, isoform A, partial [Clunio marinus]
HLDKNFPFQKKQPKQKAKTSSCEFIITRFLFVNQAALSAFFNSNQTIIDEAPSKAVGKKITNPSKSKSNNVENEIVNIHASDVANNESENTSLIYLEE